MRCIRNLLLCWQEAKLDFARWLDGAFPPMPGQGPCSDASLVLSLNALLPTNFDSSAQAGLRKRPAARPQSLEALDAGLAP